MTGTPIPLAAVGGTITATKENLQIAFANAELATSYVPTFTNLTIGNGSYVAKYVQVGDWVIGDIVIVCGSTTTISSPVSITLPSTASADYNTFASVGRGMFYDTSAAAEYDLIVSLNTASTIHIGALNAAGTYTVRAGITGSVPVATGTGDQLHLPFIYRIA